MAKTTEELRHEAIARRIMARSAGAIVQRCVGSGDDVDAKTQALQMIYAGRLALAELKQSDGAK